MAERPIIIIRKKKKGGHEGHHGGAWKVAYADFVTAMMAFFLLLWLLNVTTDIQRRGIADYFAPASISKSESGAGGVFAGESITSEHSAQISQYTPVSADEVTMPTAGKGEEGEEDVKSKSEATGGDGGADKEGKGTGFKESDGKSQEKPTAMSKQDQAMVEAMKSEENAFKQAEAVIKQAILGSPEFRDFANQIFIDRTPEGLRIQIVDRDKFSMFPSGGAVPYERARDLLRLVGKVVSKLPNNISVTGHTDSSPFTAGSRRDNWTLSTERANVSRQELVTAGVGENRIQRVVGLADREAFVPNDPKDPRNRRISIVLLRQAIPPAEMQPADGAAPPQSAPIPIAPAPAGTP